MKLERKGIEKKYIGEQSFSSDEQANSNYELAFSSDIINRKTDVS